MSAKLIFGFLLLPCIPAAGQMKVLSNPKASSDIQLINDADTFFGTAQTVLNFDELKPNTIVNSVYKKNGVIFESTNKDKSVIIREYQFSGGMGKKNSIGNAKPGYEGKLNISFPENNVSSVGFLLCHAIPNGTIVEVYGKDEKLLAHLVTTATGAVFCGVKSKAPISKLIISPVKKIDKDIAVDNFAFSVLTR